MNSKFYKVKTTDYYKKFDEVKGFKNGDKILVKWKDGEITGEILFIENGMGSAQIDMNNYPDTFNTRKYFVKKFIHGQTLYLKLRGLEIAKA